MKIHKQSTIRHRVQNTILLMVVFLASAGCQDRHEEYLTRAQSNFDARSFDKALVDVKNAIQIDSSRPEAHYLHALLLEREQSWQMMFDKLRKVIALNPSHIQANVKLGTIKLANGFYEEALKQVNAVLAVDSKNADAYALKAATQYRQGDIQLAIESAETALSYQPSNAGAVAVLIQIYKVSKPDLALTLINRNSEQNEVLPSLLEISIYQAQGKLGQAAAVNIELLKASLTIDPGNTAGLNALVNVYTAANRRKDALTYLKSHVQQHPDNTEALIVLGGLKADDGHFSESAKWYQQAIERQPHLTSGYLALGDLREQQGNNEAALIAFMEGLELESRDPSLLARAAQAKESLGKYDEAISLYETAISVDPQLWTLNNLAMLYADHAPQAADLYRAAALLNEHVDNFDAVVLDTLGWVHYKLGDEVKAIHYLKLARNEGRSDAVLAYHLGMAYILANKPTRAYQELSTAIASGEPFAGFETAHEQLKVLQAQHTQPSTTETAKKPTAEFQ